jgi:hypothetical protein
MYPRTAPLLHSLLLCVVNEELWPAKTTTTGGDFTSCVLAAS